MATSPASEGKAPRTPRGEKTLRRILDAARLEFGERGFAESSVSSITGRAEVALGTFYTYFDSKEALFAALVSDMSERVRIAVAPAFDGPQLTAHLKAVALLDAGRPLGVGACGLDQPLHLLPSLLVRQVELRGLQSFTEDMHP